VLHPTPSVGVGWTSSQQDQPHGEEVFATMPVSMHSAVRWNRWVLAPAALAVAALSAPYLLTHHSAFVGFGLQRAFALVCHQHSGRSFWIFGAPVAVCARCLGIYFGAVFGLLMRTSQRLAFRLFVAAGALNLFDVLAEVAGLHGNWMIVRFVLGLALGAAGALLISSSIPATSTRTAAIS
jgi:uncharacterized membrane protein